MSLRSVGRVLMDAIEVSPTLRFSRAAGRGWVANGRSMTRDKRLAAFATQHELASDNDQTP